jgi:hypothetical protein
MTTANICLLIFLFVGGFASYGDSLVLPEPMGKIEHSDISESSGLAHSQQVSGRYWTHNDSGGKAALYAMDLKGNPLGGPLQIEGATNQDWETVCLDTQGRMWIGDLGNNKNKRKDLKIPTWLIDSTGHNM